MLLKGYTTLRIVLPECNPSAQTMNAIAELTDDIGEVLPYLSATVKGCSYNPEARILRFVTGGRAITLYPRQVTVTRLEGETEARQVLASLKELINRTYERRTEIEPSYKRGDELKLLDVYKLLPGTNCRQCGQPTCLAFATRLIKQEADLTSCTPLYSGEHTAKREKLLSLLRRAGYL